MRELPADQPVLTETEGGPSPWEQALHGEILRRSASRASRALARYVEERLIEAFAPHPPRLAHRWIPAEEHFARLTALRWALAADPEALWLARGLVADLGLPLRKTVMDRPRLRGVLSGAHRDPKAARAYAIHRDTWYSNPEAQVNLWLALGDVPAEESFGFFTEAFHQAVPNASAGFDLDEWDRLGGWQAPHPQKAYPCATATPPGAPQRFACRDGEQLLFSAHQLHGSLGHDSGRARFSLELRLVHLPDLPRFEGRRALDNRSRGSTLPTLLNAERLDPHGGDPGAKSSSTVSNQLPEAGPVPETDED
ncbi:hypothetical protein L6R49_00315 [Myxococcota bacterium]|nr:hypothetical protein [Myxococcota bacterium]